MFCGVTLSKEPFVIAERIIANKDKLASEDGFSDTLLLLHSSSVNGGIVGEQFRSS